MARSPLYSGLTQILRGQLTDQLDRPGSPPLDRRDFVGRCASSLGAALMPTALLAGSGCGGGNGGDAKLRDERIVIVGAGLAGLTCAYRLARAGVGCTVYEASSRFGGRVRTEPNFNADGMHVERGGEVVDGSHRDLFALASELGVPLSDATSQSAGETRELYFAGGSMRSASEISAAFAPLAAILAADASKISRAGSLIVPTAHSDLARDPDIQRLDHTSIAAYLDAQTHVDDWLRHLIQNAYVAELGREASQLSALSLITTIGLDQDQGFHPFGEGGQSWRILGGSQALPDALSAQLAGRVAMHPSHRLVQIRDFGTHLLLSFDRDGKTLAVKCERAVLALPFTMLREVEGLTALELSPIKQRAIDELGYGTNSKIVLGFDSPSWQAGDTPCDSILSDLPSQAFWDAGRHQHGRRGILSNFCGGEAGANLLADAHHAILTDLARILPGAEASFDGKLLHQHWLSEPFQKGSYSCPLPGQFTTLVGQCGDPELEGRLLFAGEHVSVDSSGYMNGAVETGNLAAQALLEGQGLVTKWSEHYGNSRDARVRRRRIGRQR